MQTTRWAALAVVGLMACGSSGTSPESGPLKVGIISGNNQTATAPSAQLPASVVGKLVRLPNGTVAWLDRAGDALLPPTAYAQTVTLNGSPVAGAVVCAAPVDGPAKLTPVVACTSTASDGTATFAFTHGTTAGTAKALVQGMLGGVVATFDTASATVVADVPNATYRSPNPGGPILGSPAVISDSAMVDKYGNPIPFRIVSDGTVTAQDTVAGSIGARTLTFTTSTVKNGSLTEQVTELRGTNGVLVGHFGYVIGGSQLKLQSWRTVGSAIAMP